MYGFFKMGQLDGFSKWAVEQSLANVDGPFEQCEILHVDDGLWQPNARKIEDVKIDGEESHLFNFYNCDQRRDLDKSVSVACETSLATNDPRAETDDYHHLKTA